MLACLQVAAADFSVTAATAALYSLFGKQHALCTNQVGSPPCYATPHLCCWWQWPHRALQLLEHSLKLLLSEPIIPIGLTLLLITAQLAHHATSDADQPARCMRCSKW